MRRYGQITHLKGGAGEGELGADARELAQRGEGLCVAVLEPMGFVNDHVLPLDWT